MDPPLLDVQGLSVRFDVRGGLFSRPKALRALQDVSLSLARGEALGVVGESGSGKTTLGRSVLGLNAPEAGSIRFDGQELLGLSDRTLRPMRRRLQAVFQDPTASLNPILTVGGALREALDIHRIGAAADRPGRVRALLERVGLPASAADRRPRELSGGQRQRVGIARALAVGPELIVADEPTSALDVSVQAQILNLLQDLKRDLGLALLFISHDLGVVRHLCGKAAVLYLGRVMETGPAGEVFENPRHPYTRTLLDAAPSLGRGATRRPQLLGEPPSPLSPPSGCVFRTRCPHALARCAETVPPLEGEPRGHAAACVRQHELSL